MYIRWILLLGALTTCILCASPCAKGQIYVDDRSERGVPAGSSRSEALSRELVQLKAERDEAARFGKDDPRLQAVEKRIAELQAQLNRSNATRALGSAAAQSTPARVAPTFPRIVPSVPSGDAAPMLTNTLSTASVTHVAGGEANLSETAEDRATLKILNGAIISLTAEGASIETVLKSLQEQTRANLEIFWPTLDSAGIDRNTPIRLSISRVPLGRALTAVLNQAGGGTANLGYAIDGGMIVISTRDDLSSSKYQVIRLYSVQDFVSRQVLAQYPWNIQQLVYQERMNGLMDAIKMAIAPDSWQSTGGTVGSIREFNGVLIITQTSENHRAIVQLLAQLRAMGAAN